MNARTDTRRQEILPQTQHITMQTSSQPGMFCDARAQTRRAIKMVEIPTKDQYTASSGTLWSTSGPGARTSSAAILIVVHSLGGVPRAKKIEIRQEKAFTQNPDDADKPAGPLGGFCKIGTLTTFLRFTCGPLGCRTDLHIPTSPAYHNSWSHSLIFELEELLQYYF